VTPVESVTFTAPCPCCGRTVQWRGIPVEPGGGTSYRIDCDGEQQAEPPAEPAQLATEPAAITGLRRLWRYVGRAA